MRRCYHQPGEPGLGLPSWDRSCAAPGEMQGGTGWPLSSYPCRQFPSSPSLPGNGSWWPWSAESPWCMRTAQCSRPESTARRCPQRCVPSSQAKLGTSEEQGAQRRTAAQHLHATGRRSKANSGQGSPRTLAESSDLEEDLEKPGS